MTEQKLSTWVMYTMIFALIIVGGGSMVSHINNQYNVEIDQSWQTTYGALDNATALATGGAGFMNSTIESSNPISGFINTLTLPFRLIQNTVIFFSSLAGNLIDDGTLPLLDGFDMTLKFVIQTVILTLLLLLFVSMALRWRVA